MAVEHVSTFRTEFSHAREIHEVVTAALNTLRDFSTLHDSALKRRSNRALLSVK